MFFKESGGSALPSSTGIISKVKPDFGGYRTRRNIVRAAKGRKEVVERKMVRKVDDGQSRTHFVFVSMEHVVMADRHVEKVARRDPWRLVVVVFGVWGRHLD
jgi:hypothetical protein